MRVNEHLNIKIKRNKMASLGHPLSSVTGSSHPPSAADALLRSFEDCTQYRHDPIGSHAINESSSPQSSSSSSSPPIAPSSCPPQLRLGRSGTSIHTNMGQSHTHLHPYMARSTYKPPAKFFTENASAAPVLRHACYFTCLSAPRVCRYVCTHPSGIYLYALVSYPTAYVRIG